MDLAEFLNLKDDVFAKLEQMKNEENDNLTMEEPLVFSARQERARQSRSNSTPGLNNDTATSIDRKTSKMQKLASNHLARQAECSRQPEVQHTPSIEEVSGVRSQIKLDQDKEVNVTTDQSPRPPSKLEMTGDNKYSVE